MQQNGLYLLDDDKKGRGVYAGKDFRKGDIIEICPVIVLSQEDRKRIHQTKLHDYYFSWGKNDSEAAINLGYGSIYNHSSNPNAQFINVLDEMNIIIECIKPIRLGEEIQINYIDKTIKDDLWFEEK